VIIENFDIACRAIKGS